MSGLEKEAAKPRKKPSIVIGGRERQLKPTFLNIEAIEQETGFGYPYLMATNNRWTLNQIVCILYNCMNGNEHNRAERKEIIAAIDEGGFFYGYTPALAVMTEFGGAAKEEKKDAAPSTSA